MTNEQAQVVIKQLGGTGKLKAMIAATNFIRSDQGLSFNFKGSRKYNSCLISLTGTDTYNMKISKFSAGKESNVITYNDIYCSQLKELLSDTTGLALSL